MVARVSRGFRGTLLKIPKLSESVWFVVRVSLFARQLMRAGVRVALSLTISGYLARVNRYIWGNLCIGGIPALPYRLKRSNDAACSVYPSKIVNVYAGSKR